MNFSEFFDYEGTSAQNAAGDFVFLADLPAADWEKILSFAQCFRFSPGDLVMRQGEVSNALYVVGTGELEVFITTPMGNEKQISRISALSVFGEQAFFDEKPRSASVRALADSELHLLTRDSFDAFAARYPDLALQVVRDLGRIVSLRLRDMTRLALQGSR